MKRGEENREKKWEEDKKEGEGDKNRGKREIE